MRMTPADAVAGRIGNRVAALGGNRATGRGRRVGGDTAMRVMVVDDSVLVRAGIVRLLEAAGYDDIVEAGDAVEAMALVG